MSDEIYQQKIIRHARDDANRGRLDAPDATATVDNPMCGDRVTIDLELADGTIAQISHHTRGCVLCNASAALVSLHARGRTADELQAVRSSLQAMLEGRGSALHEPWRDLAIFEPVAKHRSRHACVLLPFQAVTEALAEDSKRETFR